MFDRLRSEKDAWTSCVKIILGLLGVKKLLTYHLCQNIYLYTLQ
jgi:hypothetical protein